MLLFGAHATWFSRWWLRSARSHEGLKQTVYKEPVHQCGFVKAPESQEQAGGAPQSKPIAAMSDTKLGMQVKGEEARVEGTKPSCEVLGNLHPQAPCQGQATVPKITSPENLIILQSLSQ